jgi:hypothetical protein
VKKYGHRLKYLMTDDDVLYRDTKVKELLDNESIIKRTSVPYKHASNGFVERSIRTIMEKARTIMLIYNCPLKFCRKQYKQQFIYLMLLQLNH